MHTYLRAIGFSQYTTRKQIESLLEDTQNTPSSMKQISTGIHTQFVQITKMYNDRTGIVLIGESDENEIFHLDHYYPICTTKLTDAFEVPITFHKSAAANSYLVSCDNDIDFLLIFFLQNIDAYVMRYWSNKEIRTADVNLTGLSVNGQIILGSNKTAEEHIFQVQTMSLRREALSTAKRGDTDALNKLERIDNMIYNNIADRLRRSHDILSIVDTTFMPYGLESDEYYVVGSIVNINVCENPLTQEQSWILTLNANGIFVDVCINKKDLYGEPSISRRFKGVIWLQGYLSFC